MKYYTTPEIIGTSRLVNEDGDDTHLGDRVMGVQILFDNRNHREGTVQLDVRLFNKRGDNLVIEVPLSDLMAALTTATLNREDNSK